VTFSQVFSVSLSERYYIVQYRRKNTFSCRRDCQLLYCHSVPLLWRFISSFTTCSRYFSLHFLLLLYSLGAQLWNCAILTPSSRVCVALMVSAPVIVGVNAHVAFRNYYNSHLSHLFSKASVIVTLLRCG